MLFPVSGVGAVIAADGSVLANSQERSVLDQRVVPIKAPTILWSGSMAEIDEPSREGAAWESSPRNWGAAGWGALEAAAARWVDAGAGECLLVRTHAAHIVSDAPSALRFVRGWADRGVRLVFDLASMITTEIATSGSVQEIYSRRVDALGNTELARGVAMVLVSNLRVEGGRVRPAPNDEGLLDPRLVHDAVSTCRGLGLATATLAPVTQRPVMD